MRENKKDLYIPLNVPDRKELISGFGTIELVISGIILLISVLIVIVAYVMEFNILYALLIAISLFTVVVMFVRKDKYGENLIYKTKYVIRFNKSQKMYQYQYHNIYEGRIKR